VVADGCAIEGWLPEKVALAGGGLARIDHHDRMGHRDPSWHGGFGA
jgi:hypothetical protein